MKEAPAVTELSGKSQVNARALSDLYDAFATRDFEAAARAVTPDFVLHVPGRSWNAGEYWGVAGLTTFMRNIGGHIGGLFELRVPAFAVTGDDAFTREAIRINRQADPEREFALNITNQFKMRDDRLSEWWVIPEDQRVYDEYYTDTPPSSVPGRPAGAAHRGTPPPRRILDADRAISPENTRLLTDMYGRFWSGDMAAMRRVIAGDVVVSITHRSAMSGEYRGWDGYMAFREKLMGMAGTRYRLDVVALAGSERDVFATESIRMNRRWDPEVQTIHVVMHFGIENGKIVRIDDFPVDPYAWERFYIPPSPQSLAPSRS